jgi:hypothetical protein
MINQVHKLKTPRQWSQPQQYIKILRVKTQVLVRHRSLAALQAMHQGPQLRIRPPERYRQDIAFIAQSWDSLWEIHDHEIQEAMSDPIAFATTSNPDTMYLHEALRAPDCEQFIEAMQKEVKDHEDLKHLEMISKSEVPEGTTILPAVWSMKRKHRISTQEVYKWKAHLNVHGSKQIKNVHYWETYSQSSCEVVIHSYVPYTCNHQ